MPETTNISKRQSTEQKRAKFAYNIAKTRMDKDYMQKVQGMTPDILNNGLLQTLAMYNTDVRGKEIVKDIQEWLFSEDCKFTWAEEKKENLIETLCECQSEKYRCAHVETLAFVKWLKRFTKANGGD